MFRKLLITMGAAALLSASIAHAYNTPTNLGSAMTKPAHQGNTGHV